MAVIREFPDFTVVDRDGNVSYVPFVAADGRVGYRVVSPKGVTFVYFNPSATDGAMTPDVFVYVGGLNAPAQDEPVTFITFPDESFALSGHSLRVPDRKEP